MMAYFYFLAIYLKKINNKLAKIPTYSNESRQFGNPLQC